MKQGEKLDANYRQFMKLIRQEFNLRPTVLIRVEFAQFASEVFSPLAFGASFEGGFGEAVAINAHYHQSHQRGHCNRFLQHEN
jgi:hypothetical protein